MVPYFAYNVQNVGLDVLGKYSFKRFHILFGPSIARSLKKRMLMERPAMHRQSSTDLPGSHSVFAAIGAGIGYDIPINNKKFCLAFARSIL